jgi:tRNA pseudouridine55 synthase
MTRSGILLIDKPEGPSSAQVVHKIKQCLGVKKVGHLGTLDPFASGLLLLGIDEGTKIADIFLSASKEYRGVMVLGVVTDSQDVTGHIMETRPVPGLHPERLTELAERFTGELQQVPPMFSALKKDGVRLYHLARLGQEVPRAPRAVRIEKLKLTQLGVAEIELDVTCSSGTYVRTLAADMGAALGCGAHLKSLRRLSCGQLSIEQAVTVEVMERARSLSLEAFLPLTAALSHLPSVTWGYRWIARLRMGQQEVLGQLGKPASGEYLMRVLDSRGNLAALAEWGDAGWRLARVFRE